MGMEECTDECYNYLQPFPRIHIQHTVQFSLFFIVLGYFFYWKRRHTLQTEDVIQTKFSKFDHFMKWAFLFVFSLEIGFKYLSNQLWFLLQPCHVVTAVELYALFNRTKKAELLFHLRGFKPKGGLPNFNSCVRPSRLWVLEPQVQSNGRSAAVLWYENPCTLETAEAANRRAANARQSRRRARIRAEMTPEEVLQAQERENAERRERRSRMRAEMTPEEVLQAQERENAERRGRRSRMRAEMTPEEVLQAQEAHSQQERQRRSAQRATFLAVNMQQNSVVFRARAIFGTPRGTFAVIETQGRDGLHVHLLHWSALSPSLLQHFVNHPVFEAAFKDLLNLHYCATLPPECHVEHLLKRARVQDVSTVRDIMRPPPPYGTLEWDQRIASAGIHSNVHSHTHTCHKPPMGEVGCRMSLPGPLAQEMRIVQIRPVHGDGISYAELEAVAAAPEPRNQADDPLPVADDRLIVWELPRPIVESDIPADIPADVAQWMRRVLPVQNGLVCPFNKLLMGMLPGNQAALLLGGPASAKVSVFYLVKYLTKDSNPLATAAAVLLHAKQHIERFPSTTGDASPERTALHLLQRTLNTLSGLMELSASQAAAVALGYPAELSSHGFVTLYADAAMGYVRSQNEMTGSGSESRDDDDDGDDTDTHSDTDIADAEEQPVDTGSAVPYRTANGIVVAVPQHVHYALRGNGLTHLSLYEYVSLVQVVPRRGSGNDSAAEPPHGARRGRIPNAIFPFEPDHPLASTHVQRLRSKILVPQPVGLPPKVSVARGPARSRVALYYLTMMRPWNANNVGTLDFSWDAFAQYCATLEESAGRKPTVVEQFRLSVMTNMAHSLRVKKDYMQAQSSFRGRNRTIWGVRRAIPDGTEPPPGARQQDVAEQGTVAAAFSALSDLNEAAHEAAQSIERQRAHDVAVNASVQAYQSITVGQEQQAVPPGSMRDYVLRPTRTVAEVHAALSAETPFVQDAVQQPAGTGADLGAVILPPSDSLSNEQRQALDIVLQFIVRGTQREEQHAPRLLIHGGPGCGKTYFVQHVIKCLNILQVGYICCAYAASAAINLPEGDTIHAVAGLGIGAGYDRVQALSDTKLFELQSRFGSACQRPARIIIIDEISMVDASLLSALSTRLQSIMCCTTSDFGGLMVLALGDFFQIPPVKGTSLTRAVVNQDNHAVDSTFSHGRRLFETFRLITFTTQQRAAGDPGWCALIDEMRYQQTITPTVLRHIRPLTAHEVAGNPDWQFPTIVVATNQEKDRFNSLQLQKYAAATGRVVLAWKKPLVSENPRLSNDQRNTIYEDNRFVGVFVHGAPVFLSANISSAATRKGVCNGTHATLHSLTFHDDVLPAVREEITAQMNTPDRSAGDTVWISHAPISVNVEVPAARLSANESLVLNQHVIPLLPSKGSKQTVRVNDVSCTVCPNEFCYDLGFSVTFHKVQGKTLSKVLINLNKMPSPPHVTFEFAYVALTRVRCGADVRVIPPTSSLDHLLRLHADEDTQRWLGAFDQDGVWRRNLVPQPTTRRKRKRAQRASIATISNTWM